MTSFTIPFSVLDLSPVIVGDTPAQAFRNTLDLAKHAEAWGYRRYWLAEHHNMTGIASAATSVVVGYVAGGTQTIRVGAGGIMLPNHAPLVIAEQFGTLESLYPGRIDLGLGRAPGTDQLTARALRRDFMSAANSFPQDVMELRRYFGEVEPGQAVRAVPGAGLQVPLWLLGSSTFSAQLAAALGLPFAFASHFAPAEMENALRLYRNQFKPSSQLAKPYAMLSLNVFAADDDLAAVHLSTSLQQQFLNLIRGRPGQVPPPVANMDGLWSEVERHHVHKALECSVVGTAENVERGMRRFIERYQPDELLVTGLMYDHTARLRSFEIVAQVRERLGLGGVGLAAA
jgi:luciferase family oxidoreductase group 1